MSCELCAIADQESYRVVYRDEYVIVVIGFEPLKFGHMMILPLRHVEDFADFTPEEASAFFCSLGRCMRVVQSISNGFPLFVFHGPGHQTQKHIHGQILPTQKGLRGLVSLTEEGVPYRERADRATLESMAEDLRQRML